MGLDVGPTIEMLVLKFGIGNAVVVAVVFLILSTGRGSALRLPMYVEFSRNTYTSRGLINSTFPFGVKTGAGSCEANVTSFTG